MKKISLLIVLLFLLFMGCKEDLTDNYILDNKQKEMIALEEVGQLKKAKIEAPYSKTTIIVKYVGDARSTVMKVVDADAAISTMVFDANVEYVERDYIISIPEILAPDPDKVWNPNKGKGRKDPPTPPVPPSPPIGPPQYSNDPYFTGGGLWGLYSDTIFYDPVWIYGSRAANAWGNGNIGSNEIVIGIIDEGVMWSHPDLAANIWINPKEIPDNGKDDDLNGYIDDIRGWDFYNNNNSTFDGVTDDHGTHVAGTIGAKGGNGEGICGMVWNTKIVNAKFLENSGTISNGILAFGYLIDLKKAGVNIVVINCSWGGGGFSQALHDIINEAGLNGILVVCAAGNNNINTDFSPAYPASYDCANIISVAAMDAWSNKCSFSNFGSKSVDLGAPGSLIMSTIPLSLTSGGYANYQGTSMAAPHVTGAVALYKNRYRDATITQVKTAILASVIPNIAFSQTVTGGVLNVSNF